MAPPISVVLAFSLFFNVVSAVEKGVAEMRFSYQGTNGPEHWGQLTPNFATCSTGKIQSPVDIITNQTVHNDKLKRLEKKYSDANATLMNSGYLVGVHYEHDDAGELTIEGTKYFYKQMHWHTPSEHRINGKRFPAELHLVHQSLENDIAVVGILYKYGDANPLIDRLMPYLPKLNHESCTSKPKVSMVDVGIMDNDYEKQHTIKYYRYRGSLTTPPCTEKVIWSVLSEVRTITRAQVMALRKPLCSDCYFNSRPVQPLNGRTIELYKARTRKKPFPLPFIQGQI